MDSFDVSSSIGHRSSDFSRIARLDFTLVKRVSVGLDSFVHALNNVNKKNSVLTEFFIASTKNLFG